MIGVELAIRKGAIRGLGAHKDAYERIKAFIWPVSLRGIGGKTKMNRLNLPIRNRLIRGFGF